jgi:hypothetical protein
LVVLCQRRGIKLERYLTRDFDRLTSAVLEDRFLGETERELLLAQGRNLFANAPQPAAVVQRILRQKVAATKTYSELDLRSGLEKRVAGRSKLSRSAWAAIERGAIEEAASAGVDIKENSLGALCEQFRSDSEIAIRDGLGPATMVVLTLLAATVWVGILFLLDHWRLAP